VGGGRTGRWFSPAARMRRLPAGGVETQGRRGAGETNQSPANSLLTQPFAFIGQGPNKS
jgi:hypothetical protein